MTLLTAPPTDRLEFFADPFLSGPDLPGTVEPPRVLLPLAGPTDDSVIDVAVRVARAEEAMLVATYLAVVPLRFDADEPRYDPSWLAAPLFDAVEWAALGSGVPVLTRIGTGRTLRHALARLWEDDDFTRVIATMPPDGEPGFTERDLAWLVANAPGAAVVLKPANGMI